MLGSVILISLLFVALAEWFCCSGSRPQWASRFKYLRILLALAWALWAVWHHWDSPVLAWFLVFHGVAETRSFLVGFGVAVATLAITTLLRPYWAALRQTLVPVNMLVALVFALVSGATIDWNASLPYALLLLAFLFTPQVLCVWWLSMSDPPNRPETGNEVIVCSD